MRIVEAPNLPGRWLVAIVEQWGDRHEVLWAHHAPTATQASEIGLPQLEMILRARKV